MHQFQCKCGALRGHIHRAGINNRIVCYCADCQTFAHFLGGANETLDAQGGTEIVQVAQHRIRFSQGVENLALLRLSEKGLMRWYASCCNTPFGNTLSNPKFAFIGLIHSSLDRSTMDADFGKHVAIANIHSAIGEPKPKQSGVLGVLARFIGILLSARIGGKYKASPLFNQAGDTIVPPKVLTNDDRRKLSENTRNLV